MDTSVQHFAEDPDALSDYILRRLDRATLARCDEHVQSCESCRQAVHAERTIAAGIKRAGRDQLKERLGMLVGMPSTRRIAWPYVLSVAAVFLILIGIGVYRQWFVTYNDVAALERPLKEEKADQATPQVPNEQARPAQTASRSSESMPKQRDAGQEHQPEENMAKGKNEKLGYAQAPMDRLEESPAASGKDKGRADIPRSAMVTPQGQQEFWARGTLITQAFDGKETGEDRAAKTLMTDGVHGASARLPAAIASLRVTVEQRSASRLPSDLQRQQLHNRQTIQTLVRQAAGETRLTLYPESPFDSTQLRSALAHQVAPDSLIVQIGGQQIGYRFPAGTLGTMQVDTTKPGRK